jgi:serine/threonine-protein phosphatase 2A regulatory subunit A
MDSTGEAAVLRGNNNVHHAESKSRYLMNAGGGGLLPIAVLIDELKHEDVAVRMNSVQKIDVIADKLGHERTRNEFVPFLSAFLEEEDEEVLVILANKLPLLIPMIGGVENADSILGLLRRLSVFDENAVYEASIASILKIAEQCPDSLMEKNMYNLVLEKLVESGLLNARRAACALIPHVYAKLKPEIQKQLISYAFLF